MFGVLSLEKLNPVITAAMVPILLVTDEVSDCQPEAVRRPERMLHRYCTLVGTFVVTFVVTVSMLDGLPLLAQHGAARPLVRTRRQGRLLTGEALTAYERLGRRLAIHQYKNLSRSAPSVERVIPPGLTQSNMAYMQCAINVDQFVASLGQSVIWLDRAIVYDGYQCPNNTLRGCLVSISALTTSVLGVASCLTLLASSCTATISYPASCGSDILSLIANLGEVFSSGTGAADDCVFADPKPVYDSVHRVLNITRHRNYTALLGRRLSKSNNSLRSALHNMQAVKKLRQKQANDLSLCVLDVLQGSGYLLGFIQNIMGAWVDTCDDQKVCAVNIFDILSSLFWAAQYFTVIAGDCLPAPSQMAYCLSDMFDIVAAIANQVSTGEVIRLDCLASENVTKLTRRQRKTINQTYFSKVGH